MVYIGQDFPHDSRAASVELLEIFFFFFQITDPF